ncbi:MAG: ATP-binding protein, partial [Alphaproteobacteria bacterium]|nr:ATP-binding protein [Alphaproteobacteria bacterium]
ILGFAQVIKVQYFGPDAQDKYVEYAADIERGGQHLLNIIDDILDLSKIEAGKMTLEETEVDIAEVVDECISMVSVRAQGASLKLDRHLAAGLPMVLADRRALKQILLNLIGNAIKFTPPGGRITVALSRRDDGELELSVSDTGIGIAAEQIDLIFMPFNQADVSWSRRIQGTGLGLPLTRELVELHGGRIELDSVVDVGTTVTITLPAARLLD